jgi:predicted RNA-binding Zn-ribbon protein involved in translation (DUF1610 family)
VTVVNVDCQTCGWNLVVPNASGEGHEFACGHCGALLRNDEEARAFRWDRADPFVRRRGATRLVFLTGIAVGLLWVPAAAIALGLRHRLDPVFIAALAIPWTAIVAWLARLRAGSPKVRWYIYLWISVGAFTMYVALLVAVIPAWRPLLGIGDDPEALKLVFVFGVMSMMVGVAGASLYRWVLKRTPTARATPPVPPGADPS